MLCQDKVPFSTLRGAAQAAVEQLALGRLQRPYACDTCTSYHLTTKPFDRGGEVTEVMVLNLASSVKAR
jgi:hypothetical protein